MKIAFHSPLKSPNHPVPSGDRLMARLLIAALRRAGHAVDIVSELRTFMKEPSADRFDAVQKLAEAEIERLSALWLVQPVPDLWLTYHLYYKAPDLIGPALAHRFGIPYVTVEASYSSRRNIGVWVRSQALVAAAIEQAAVNICFTKRDRDGLLEALPSVRVDTLPPFLDGSAFLARAPRPQPGRLITVAMMRSGDKMESYALLAGALKLLRDLPWTLSIIGDGPCRAEVEVLFAGLDAGRIEWHGEKSQDEIATLLSESAVYVWPGCGEAYGLAYLEAQAAGVPVVAQAIAGVPEVVTHDSTGLLTPPGDIAAYADAIRRLLTREAERDRMAEAARKMVGEERSLEIAATRIDTILNQQVGNR